MSTNTWPLGAQYSESMARTEPGPGARLGDDGVPSTTSLRMRSIPHVPTARLCRRWAHLNEITGTAAGLRQWDQSRRALIEQAMHRRAIEHELVLRGVAADNPWVDLAAIEDEVAKRRRTPRFTFTVTTADLLRADEAAVVDRAREIQQVHSDAWSAGIGAAMWGQAYFFVSPETGDDPPP